MPVYIYVCSNCEEEIEVTLSIEDRNKLVTQPCPYCTKNSLVRQLSPISFTIKGACAANGYSTNVADIEKRLGRPINNNDLPE